MQLTKQSLGNNKTRQSRREGMGVSMSCSFSLARCQTEPILILLLSLAFYFLLLDIQLCLQLLQPAKNDSSLSVKGVMQAPTVHYIDLPLAEAIEGNFSIHTFLTPNQVSYLGVVFGFVAAWLISSSIRIRTLLGVLAYKVRDLADSLDGVVFRGAGARVIPTPGSQGYYVDGWCDVASDVFLLIGVALLLTKQEKGRLYPGKERERVSLLPEVDPEIRPERRFFRWIWIGAALLGIQAILASTGWNYTTHQLSSLLETPGSERPHIFRSPPTLVVMYLWRLGNPHMLSQFLLAAITLDRVKQWLLFARGLLFIPLILTCLISISYVSYISAKFPSDSTLIH